VDTPFPPLNLRKGEKSWPIIDREDKNNKCWGLIFNIL
jgi:hypothetical protein